jgi:predicted glutamine amidotransferase
MCGLVGVAGNLYKAHTDAFTDMLFCDTLRGNDSTGVISSDQKGDLIYIKRLGPASDLIDVRGYDEVVAVNRRMIMGHNRSATIGGKSKLNAHPFIFDRYAGAHNGTLANVARNRMKDNHKYGTDSEALIGNIEFEGIEATINKLEGAWALTILDRDEMTLNFIRNDQRPLFYAFDKKREVLLWASEVGMLMWIMSRRGIEADKFHQLPVDMLYTFKIPAGADKWEEPVTQGIKGFEKPVTENFQYGGPYAGFNFRDRGPSLSPGDNSASNGSAKDSGNRPKSGSVTKDRTSKAILKELEAACPNGIGPWWDCQIDVDIGEKHEWQWHTDESSIVWLKRCMAMLKLGWEWGDETASPALTPPKKTNQVVVMGTPPAEPTQPEAVFNVDKSKIWNSHHRKMQPLPFKEAEVFWSERNKLWVFNPAIVDQDIPNKDKYWKLSGTGIDWVSVLDNGLARAESKRKADLIKENVREEWDKAVEDFDYFTSLREKLNQGKRLNKSEKAWYEAYEDASISDPPFEVVKKPESNVVPIRPYKHPNTRADLTQVEFEEITQNGCDWCTRGLKWGDNVRFHCDTTGVVECFCETCVDGSADVKHYLGDR